MASLGIDVEEIMALVRDLGGVERRVVPAIRKVTAKAAVNIKNDARARIIAQSSGKYVKQYPDSITYDLKESGTEVTAEVGPDKDRPQGPLGNLLEYGTSERPPFPHLQPAFEAELDPYERFMGDAGAEAVLP